MNRNHSLKTLVLLSLTFLSLGTSFGQQSAETDTISLPSYDHLIPAKNGETSESPAPKNIILLIGDGMGLTQISSAFYFKETLPHFARFPNIGLIRTSSTSRITDSAAGATAFSTGKKSYNGAIGVDADTVAQNTILEILSGDQWKTGLVATSSITHATPASFFAHVKSRGMAEEIAAQLSTSEVDFFVGGGLKYFTDSSRSDGQNYLQVLEKNGFTVETENLDPVLDPGKKYAYLMAQDAMEPVLEGRGDFLPKATRLALEYLSSEENGFFLMVEGSQIDWGGHANNADYLISEMIDFDDAIGAALDFAEKDGNTLVIVTADHETGGFTLASGKSYNHIKGTFSTGGHSTALIPVAAFGPGSDLFRGVYENNQIFHKMMRALSNSRSN